MKLLDRDHALIICILCIMIYNNTYMRHMYYRGIYTIYTNILYIYISIYIIYHMYSYVGVML